MLVRNSVASILSVLAVLAATGCGGGGGSEVPRNSVDPQIKADLRAFGEVLMPRVVESGVARYAMTVTNAGPDTASDVVITTSFSAAQTPWSVTCAASGGAVCPTNLDDWMKVSALPKDGSLTFTLAAKLADYGVGASAVAWISVQSNGDPDLDNNKAFASIPTTRRNSVLLQSEVGDFIGDGGTYAYNQANASIVVNANGGLLNVKVSGDESWMADFKLPGALSQFQTGTFSNLTRYPLNDPAAGGLNVTRAERQCNLLGGTFTVSDVSYVNGALDAIELNFEQRCENGNVALLGQIHWTSSDDTRPPVVINPPPEGLWAPAPGVTPASGSYVYLQSDMGDWIGLGGTYIHTRSNAEINVTVSGSQLSVAVAGDQSWNGAFKALADMNKLQPGYYGDLASDGMSWFGNGGGCNTLRGWFVIDSINFDSGGEPIAVELRFEQRCEGSNTAALRGKIKWMSADYALPPGPVNPPPAGLWTPAPGATPASGDYVYLQSESGDAVGRGRTYTYPRSNAQIDVYSALGSLSVDVFGNGGSEQWRGEFQTMNSIDRLQLGFYGDLRRYPFHNPIKGGLSFMGGNSFCNYVLGWLVVDRVTYDAQGLAAIELRFQQRCEGATPALYGKIVWTR